MQGRGDVAQLGERRTCTAEAVGSNPIISIAGAAREIQKFWNFGISNEFEIPRFLNWKFQFAACSGELSFEVFDN